MTTDLKTRWEALSKIKWTQKNVLHKMFFDSTFKAAIDDKHPPVDTYDDGDLCYDDRTDTCILCKQSVDNKSPDEIVHLATCYYRIFILERDEFLSLLKGE